MNQKKALIALLVLVAVCGRPAVSAAAIRVVKYYHADALGSVRVVTGSTGAVLERHDYLPFGEECTSGPCSSDTPVGAGQTRKFTGSERDTETGLDYLKARYARAATGRFTTVDHLSFQAAMLLDPQRFNLYAYARNNPLRFVDPDGEAIELVGTEEERKKELGALREGVGKAAGGYLYENAVTDANGVTRYYVGIQSGGPDGKGPSFSSINEASKGLAQIIGMKEVVGLKVVAPGDSIGDNRGRRITLGASPKSSPGITLLQDGRFTSFFTGGEPGQVVTSRRL